MSEIPSIDKIRERHETLYERVLADQKALSKKGVARDEFIKDVDKLLKDINHASGRTTSFEDYRWLSDTVVKWQVVFTSLLNSPRTFRISPPPPGLLPTQSPGQSLLESELDYWLERHEKYFECYRQAKEGRWSTAEEKAEDKRLARVFLASDIIDGKTNFVMRIATNSYHRLESEWLDDLKVLRAYLLWLDRNGGIDPMSQNEDYANVCNHLRNMLVNPGIKAGPAQFGETRAYIEERYLQHGKIDPIGKESYLLVERKAYHLYEKTGEHNGEVNWAHAKTYTSMFYENIIPAVVDDDRESVRSVLKALQSSGAAKTHYLINCFEATLVTYFINPTTIESLWKESEDRLCVPSSIMTAVPVSSWPRNFVVPPSSEGAFEFSGAEIVFRGVMSDAQKKALLAATGQEHHAKIEELFMKSREVSRQTTL
jgi:hypothetical protein